MDLEAHNLAQIERLTQRGGRTLSIIDLMNDGTITAEMAAFCWLAVAAGDSFITGAVPGGAGKTTLMGALLGFLPPGEAIVTVSDRAVIREASGGGAKPPVTLLAHEIGSGSWFGYIWGRDVADFFALTRRGVRCVSCIHADSPEESWESLSSLGVGSADFGRARLQLYMHYARRGLRALRRVRGLHYVVDGRHRPLYRWRGDGDEFTSEQGRGALCALLADRLGATPAQVEDRWARCERYLGDWQGEDVRDFGHVRQRIRSAYEAGLASV